MLLNIKSVMEILGVKRTAVYRMVADGVIPAPIKVGGASRWLSDEIQLSISKMIDRRNNPQVMIKKRGRPSRFISKTLLGELDE